GIMLRKSKDNNNMDEDEKNRKRSMERFSLGLPSLISVEDENGEQDFLELRTENISAGGAYFKTGHTLPVGTKVDLDLGLDKDGKRILVKVSGTVIRTDNGGMAISFGKNCQIIPLCEQESVVVHIIGLNKLQNNLLARFLETNAGLKCRCDSELNPQAVVSHEPVQGHLVLLDCADFRPSCLWNGSRPGLCLPQCFFALFNVNPDEGIEKKVLVRGIRGIFYYCDSPEVFPKGIASILRGELYPPDLLPENAPEPSKNNMLEGIPLTAREKEILFQLASGGTNQEIAEKLFISKHTVRTHLYNIYRKISVPNRFQAVLWARNYFS
ncbi:LuxR C-terminal-related transcriptional regulator, partial [Desulfococcaceae bacterium HSG8]|nr:LuxR C-terminal-related transcriptional regulator [Desulfococcaceae bacterium HSG8]